jgi:hypothetical protein
MEWEPVAHYPTARGFGILPGIYERFIISFGRRTEQERALLPTEESPTNQKSGSTADPTVNRTLLTVSPPTR